MIKEIESGELPVILNNPTPIALAFGVNGNPESQSLSPVMERVSDRLEDQVELYYVDVNKVPEIKEKYRVGELPTMILFKEGKPEHQLVGYHSEQEIINFLTQ